MPGLGRRQGGGATAAQLAPVILMLRPLPGALRRTDVIGYNSRQKPASAGDG